MPAPQGREHRSQPRLMPLRTYQGADMGYFSEISGKELPHRAMAVYMYLKDRSNKEGQCYLAIDMDAKELWLSRRTAERAIDALIRDGFITKEQRWRESGGKRSMLFTLKGN